METLLTEVMTSNEELALLNPVGTLSKVIINCAPQTCHEHASSRGFYTRLQGRSVWAPHQLLLWPGHDFNGTNLSKLNLTKQKYIQRKMKCILSPPWGQDISFQVGK